jgi:hypothetical protein
MSRATPGDQAPHAGEQAAPPNADSLSQERAARGGTSRSPLPRGGLLDRPRRRQRPAPHGTAHPRGAGDAPASAGAGALAGAGRVTNSHRYSHQRGIGLRRTRAPSRKPASGTVKSSVPGGIRTHVIGVKGHRGGR